MRYNFGSHRIVLLTILVVLMFSAQRINASITFSSAQALQQTPACSSGCANPPLTVSVPASSYYICAAGSGGAIPGTFTWSWTTDIQGATPLSSIGHQTVSSTCTASQTNSGGAIQGVAVGTSAQPSFAPQTFTSTALGTVSTSYSVPELSDVIVMVVVSGTTSPTSSPAATVSGSGVAGCTNPQVAWNPSNDREIIYFYYCSIILLKILIKNVKKYLI